MEELRLTEAEEANARLIEVENQIEKRIKGVLEIMKGHEVIVGCSFRRYNFTMKIYISDHEYNEYEISVQGKGGDINKYLPEMLEIIKSELK